MVMLSRDIAWEESARFEQPRREWRAAHKVLMSAVTDGPLEILKACPDMAPFAVHPKDVAAFVAEFNPERIKGTSWWDCLLRYSTDIEFAISPLAAPAQIEIQSIKRSLPALFDVNSNPIINQAGDFYTEPVPERPITDLIFRVTKNLPITLPDWTTDYIDCVNSDAVTIRGRTCAPGTLYFAALSVGSDQNVPGATDTVTLLTGRSTPFAQSQFELHYRRDGWTLLLPNWGYFQLVPIPGQKGKVVGLETGKTKAGVSKRQRVRGIPAGWQKQPCYIGPVGDIPRAPVFLDINGQMIINPTADQIVTLEFVLHESKPFNGKLPLA